MTGHANSDNQSVTSVTEKEGKYLTFLLAEEEYGISILKIKEIIGMMTITTIPQAPTYMKGVINLRGKVISVIDLRLRFHIDARVYNERTCIIVVEITDKSNTLHVGLVVDAVSEVVHVKGADIEPPPQFGAQVDTDYILGMAKTDVGVKILLDIDKVLNAEEISTFDTDD